MAKAKHHFLRLRPSTFFGFFVLLSSLCIASMKMTTALREMLHCTSLITSYYYGSSTATNTAAYCCTIIINQNPWNPASPLQLKLLSSCTTTSTSSPTFNTPKYAPVVTPLLLCIQIIMQLHHATTRRIILWFNLIVVITYYYYYYYYIIITTNNQFQHIKLYAAVNTSDYAPPVVPSLLKTTK